jgi:glucose/arabinose dehydrogenase
MRRTIGLVVALLLVTAVAGASPARQAAPSKPDPWLVKTTKLQFQPQKAADASVQLDLPKKDWMVLPSSGSVLLVIASRKGDAVVLVERSSLQQPLQAADITDLFAQIETDDIKERQPKSADFQSKVLDSGDRRLVAVQYTRPGVLGAEKVRQYSIPVGKQLYRVTCISRAAQFAAYDPVFAHVAASFTTTE